MQVVVATIEGHLLTVRFTEHPHPWTAQVFNGTGHGDTPLDAVVDALARALVARGATLYEEVK